MSANVSITMTVPAGGLGDRLHKFLELCKTHAPEQTLARAAWQVDQSVDPLLRKFPVDRFWLAIQHLDEAGRHPEGDGTTVYELGFSYVEYPYARAFAQQFKTWLGAIGCTEVYSEVHNLFSDMTGSSILDVTAEYRNGNLALFLGAGVSIDLGLPSWPGLLKRLIEDWVASGKGNRTVADRLSADSLEGQARWLENELGADYLEKVRQALYRDAYRNDAPSSGTMDAILQMKNLRAICTYNYDNLLEIRDEVHFKSVTSAREGYSGAQIPVYHVHGMLPYIGSPRGDIILSEADYHELANKHMSWANVVQVNLLRECTCLLIGLSANDRNLRRILDFVEDERAGQIYIIQKMDEVPDTDPDSLQAWSITKEFDRQRFADIYLRTIWINDFEEIPAILKSCVGAAG